MPKRSLSDNAYKYIYWGVLAVYFAALVYLFYSELAVYPTDPDFRFESDTYVHVKFAVEDGFFHSLSAFIYLALSKLPFMNFTISVLLALVTAGTVIATEKLIRILPGAENMPLWMVYITSILFNFSMGFYLPFVNKQHYIGYQNANMWHNSTYIFMRLFAVLTVYFFVLLYRKAKEEISFKSWALFTLALCLSTAFKASFFIVFAPFLAAVLLYDLISKNLSFKKVLILALSVVPSMAVLLIQSLVLFTGDEESGIVLAPFKTFSQRGDHPKVTLILSVLFLLSVLVFNLTKIFKDKVWTYGLLFFGIGFLESFLFAESGSRSLDSNFMWGYSAALFFVFIAAFLRAYRSFKEKKGLLPLFAVQCLILLWHAVSGIWHFVLLLQGFTYFA